MLGGWGTIRGLEKLGGEGWREVTGMGACQGVRETGRGGGGEGLFWREGECWGGGGGGGGGGDCQGVRKQGRWGGGLFWREGECWGGWRTVWGLGKHEGRAERRGKGRG